MQGEVLVSITSSAARTVRLNVARPSTETGGQFLQHGDAQFAAIIQRRDDPFGFAAINRFGLLKFLLAKSSG
ncbi:MAG: hypothetical protein R3C99_21630 [Pirellulaceae bacterium]